jgi:hypothetical protein
MNKKIITEIVQNQLPYDHEDKNTPLEDLMFKWWVTGRTGTGLRLTSNGYMAFVSADIQEYNYSINIEEFIKKLNNIKAPYDLTLKIGKVIKCPWFMSPTTDNGNKSRSRKIFLVRIFDSKVAMMINLYGSFEDYLQLAKT